MKDNYSLHIAEMLVEQRKKSGKLQEDLARYCGVSKSAVSKWEKGISRPSIFYLPKIASFYHITIQKLLTGNEKDFLCRIFYLFIFFLTCSESKWKE